MESTAHLVPAKEHDGYKGALHKEGQDALDGEWSAEDVAYEPGVVAPVGTKLKFQDDACGYAHGKVDAEEFLPEASHFLPESFACAIIASFGNAHDERQSQGEWNKQPVIDGSECELCPRPIYGTRGDV